MRTVCDLQQRGFGNWVINNFFLTLLPKIDGDKCIAILGLLASSLVATKLSLNSWLIGFRWVWDP